MIQRVGKVSRSAGIQIIQSEMAGSVQVLRFAPIPVWRLQGPQK